MAEIRDNMGIEDKIRGVNERWTIIAAEMQDTGDIRDVDTGKRIRWKRKRRGTGERRDVVTPDIAVFGQRL